jgi:hypothetical protein
MGLPRIANRLGENEVIISTVDGIAVKMRIAPIW